MLPSPPQQLPSWLLLAVEQAREDYDKNPDSPDAWDRFEALQSFLDKETFQDNIHGAMRFNRLEVRVINSPEFQRLRRITQLSFAGYVFNTAEHSRFSHSLGACQVSKRLVDIVNERTSRSVMKLSMSQYRKDPTFERLTSLHTCVGEHRSASDDCKRAENLPFFYQTITWTERVIIGLATLLHDLPHCPFSHDIEGGYPELPRHDDFSKNPAMRIYLFDTRHSVLARVLEHFSPQFLDLARQDPRWKNDPRFQIERGSDEAKHLLANLVFELHAFTKPVDPNNEKTHYVSVHPMRWPDGISSPSPDALPETEQEEWRWPDIQIRKRWQAATQPSQWLQLYRLDIVENTICADLIDYLERDAMNAGMQHSMDFKFLEHACLGLYKEAKQSGLRMVFDLRDVKRGTPRHDVITELFNYLQQHYFLRERVCYHRGTQAGAAMLKRAASLVFLQDQKEPTKNKRLTLEKLHLDIRCNSDDSLLRYLATDCGSNKDDNLSPMEQWARPFNSGSDTVSAEIGKRLIERRLYRPLVILAGHKLNIQTDSNTFFRGTSDMHTVVNDLYKAVMQDNPEKNGKTLPDGERLDLAGSVREIEKALANILHSDSDQEAGVICYCLKPNLGYKDPLVLCRWIDRQVVPLNELPSKGAKGVAEQIEAMKQNYFAIWRLFVFVRPEYLVPSDVDEVKGSVEKRCENAVKEFIRWAHQVDNDRIAEDDVYDRNLNCVEIKEIVGNRRESCRDVRYAFPDEFEADEAESGEQEEPSHNLILRDMTEEANWRQAADTFNQVFTPTQIKTCWSTFEAKGVLDASDRLYFLNRLFRDTSRDAEGMKAARKRTSFQADLAKIIDEGIAP